MKEKKAKTATERKRLQRQRDAEKHAKLGGKLKSIHFFNATMKHLDILKNFGNYEDENEAIIDAIAVAAMMVLSNKGDMKEFDSLLKNVRAITPSL